MNSDSDGDSDFGFGGDDDITSTEEEETSPEEEEATRDESLEQDNDEAPVAEERIRRSDAYVDRDSNKKFLATWRIQLVSRRNHK